MQSLLTSGAYFGEATKHRERAGLILTESAYAPGTEIPPHVHENPFFYLVLEGVCQETSGYDARIAPPATLVYHPAQEWHANRWEGARGRCFHIELSTEWTRRLQTFDVALERPAEYRNGLIVWLATRLYTEFYRDDPAATLTSEGLTLELIGEIVRLPEAVEAVLPPRWLERVRELLHDRFAERLAVDDLAEAVQVHPAHLVRAFHRYYHCTLGDYQRRLRIDFACRQLSADTMSLGEIALTAGFSDQSHFCNTFKRLVGLTPTQFQQHFRQRKFHTMP